MGILLEKKVDGLIICPAKGDKEYIKGLQKEKIPNVLVDRYFSDVEGNIVVVDNKLGAFKIVEKKIKAGSRRIGFVNFNIGLIHMDYRFEGYKAALKEYEIPYDQSLVKNVSYDDIEEKTSMAMKELIDMEKHIDVIFFANNQLAFIGVKFLKMYDKRFLDSVSICSFDSYSFMELLEIPLVYGVQPIDSIGKNAVELIMKQIETDILINEKRVLPIDICEIK